MNRPGPLRHAAAQHEETPAAVVPGVWYPGYGGGGHGAIPGGAPWYWSGAPWYGSGLQFPLGFTVFFLPFMDPFMDPFLTHF